MPLGLAVCHPRRYCAQPRNKDSSEIICYVSSRKFRIKCCVVGWISVRGPLCCHFSARLEYRLVLRQKLESLLAAAPAQSFGQRPRMTSPLQSHAQIYRQLNTWLLRIAFFLQGFMLLFYDLANTQVKLSQPFYSRHETYFLMGYVLFLSIYDFST